MEQVKGIYQWYRERDELAREAYDEIAVHGYVHDADICARIAEHDRNKPATTEAP